MQHDGNNFRGDLAELVWWCLWSFLTTVMQESFVRCRKRMQLQEKSDKNEVKWHRNVCRDAHIQNRHSFLPVAEPGGGSSGRHLCWRKSSFHITDGTNVDNVSNYWYKPKATICKHTDHYINTAVKLQQSITLSYLQFYINRI